jgi:hypothetical protein
MIGKCRKQEIVSFRFIKILSKQRWRTRCSKKYLLRALALTSMLSLIRFSERSKNLAGIMGIARSNLHVADQRRMLCSSSYACWLMISLLLMHCYQFQGYGSRLISPISGTIIDFLGEI